LFASIGVLASGSVRLASDTVCDPRGCIAVSKFATNIYTALNGKVVGYAINVGGWFPYYGGWARTAADPPKTRMGGGLRTNVASVSKVLTTIGVLQSLSKNKLTLDAKILPYLYRDWPKGPNIDTITFRELMTHRAGFRVNCGGARTTYAVLKSQIATVSRLPIRASRRTTTVTLRSSAKCCPLWKGIRSPGRSPHGRLSLPHSTSAT
jgi:CubicO group peptidase (beta-lactamase class C family)